MACACRLACNGYFCRKELIPPPPGRPPRRPESEQAGLLKIPRPTLARYGPAGRAGGEPAAQQAPDQPTWRLALGGARGAGREAAPRTLDWLVELEREEDWAREDKYDAAAFGVFMGPTGFSRFQGGLREWRSGTSGTISWGWTSTTVTRRPKGAAETCA